MSTRTPHSTPSAQRAIVLDDGAATALEGGRKLHRLRIGDEEFIALSVAIQSPTADRDVGLTAAEREVARLVREGKSNRDIAELRGGSVRTVANQVASILRKYGVRSRAELVVRAHGGERVPSRAP